MRQMESALSAAYRVVLESVLAHPELGDLELDLELERQIELGRPVTRELLEKLVERCRARRDRFHDCDAIVKIHEALCFIENAGIEVHWP